MSDQKPQKTSGWLAPLLVVTISAFMTLLDSSIVNVAIITSLMATRRRADRRGRS